MKRKVAWVAVSCVMLLSLAIASCSPETPTSTTTTSTPPKTTTVPPTTKPVSSGEPQYGDEFAYALSSDPASFDPYRTFTTVQPWQGCMLSSLSYECLSLKDWTVSRDVFDFKTNLLPEIVWGPGLAESWDFPDNHTIVWHIRPGVHFANIAPVNGREMTATDVKYSFDRITGKGSGFIEKSPFIGPIYDMLDSVDAPDKYTVIFNLNNDAFLSRHEFYGGMLGSTIVPREAVEKWGNLDLWSSTIGTGPFIFKDYVTGSSLTAIKNQDYWAYDKAYPNNKLPYLDKVKFFIIQDSSTRTAALRTGRIDLSEGVDWSQMEELKKTNPDLKVTPTAMNAWGIAMKVDREPFSDIRVRRAMQMAINSQELADIYYGGYADPTPYGMIGQDDHRVPYAEWPDEIKGYYAYDPEGAKALLAEAGYPDGLSSTLTISSAFDSSLYEALVSYWSDINANIALDTKEPGVFSSYTMGGYSEMCPTAQGTVTTDPPPRVTEVNCSYHPWGAYWKANDPYYDDLWRKSANALTLDEMMQFDKEIDMYQIENAWTVRLPRVSNFNLCQPYLNGYNGEMGFQFGWLAAHFWVDQTMKK